MKLDSRMGDRALRPFFPSSVNGARRRSRSWCSALRTSIRVCFSSYSAFAFPSSPSRFTLLSCTPSANHFPRPFSFLISRPVAVAVTLTLTLHPTLSAEMTFHVLDFYPRRFALRFFSLPISIRYTYPPTNICFGEMSSSRISAEKTRVNVPVFNTYRTMRLFRTFSSRPSSAERILGISFL